MQKTHQKSLEICKVTRDLKETQMIFKRLRQSISTMCPWLGLLNTEEVPVQDGKFKLSVWQLFVITFSTVFLQLNIMERIVLERSKIMVGDDEKPNSLGKVFRFLFKTLFKISFSISFPCYIPQFSVRSSVRPQADPKPTSNRPANYQRPQLSLTPPIIPVHYPPTTKKTKRTSLFQEFLKKRGTVLEEDQVQAQSTILSSTMFTLLLKVM